MWIGVELSLISVCGCVRRALEDVSPAVSTYFLSQLAAVLIEDDLYLLSPEQKVNVDCALQRGQVFRSVAEHHHRTQLNSLGKVALAKLYPRRGSEWSPDLLPRQLKLIEEKTKGIDAIASTAGATAEVERRDSKTEDDANKEGDDEDNRVGTQEASDADEV